MSIKDDQKGILSNRFNKAVTSSLGVTADQDKLINAANAVGDSIGFIGRADHFGYGDQLRKLKADIQKKKDKFLREITRMNLSQAMDKAKEFIDDLNKHAEEWRQKQSDTLDLIHCHGEAHAGAQVAWDNDEFARDENGKFVNEDLQTVTEAGLIARGKDPETIKDMTDEEIKAEARFALDHKDEIAKSLSDKSELEGGTAEILEKAADKLKKDLLEIRNNTSLSDEDKKDAIYQKTMDAADDVVKKLQEMDIKDEMINEIVRDAHVEKEQTPVASNEAGTFLSNLGL